MNSLPRESPRAGDGPWAQSAEWAFRFAFFLVLAMAAAWLLSGVHRIAADKQAIVFRFGRVVNEHGAGLLLTWPAPVDRVVIVPSNTQQIEFHLPRLDDATVVADDAGQDADESFFNPGLKEDPRENTAYLLTGDASVVHIQATLFYQITDPAAYIVAGEHVAPALERLFIASAVATAASRDLDTVLVARPEAAALPAQAAMRERLRNDLAGAVNQRLEKLAAQHDELGLRISRVDLVAAIPDGASEAFQRVLTVTQEVQQKIAESRTAAEVKMQQARQAQTRIMTDAVAHADEEVTNAQTQTASIVAIAEQHDDAASRQTVIHRLYYERAGALLRKMGDVQAIPADGGSHLILSGSMPR